MGVRYATREWGHSPKKGARLSAAVAVGYLGNVGNNRNVPTQRAMDLGLFRIKETAVTHSDGHVTINRTPKVTGKGQIYFIKRYCPKQLA